jgi:capsular polysaccharide export protein
MGFEALIHGAEVSCFGCAFYAGWGLTDDRVSMPARRGAAPLEALVAAAYVDYTRYIAPATGDRITLEAAVAALAAQRRAAAPAP